MKPVVTILLVFFFITIIPVHAQDTVTYKVLAKNSFYLEVFGSGFLYSINYDRILLNTKIIKLCGRIGVAALPISSYGFSSPIASLTPTLTILYGNKVNRNQRIDFFEFGFGYSFVGIETYSMGLLDYRFYYSTGIIGYRCQSLKEGLMYRIAFTPVIKIQYPEAYKSKRVLFPWVGWGIGYSF